MIHSFLSLCLYFISLTLDTQFTFPPEKDANSIFSLWPSLNQTLAVYLTSIPLFLFVFTFIHFHNFLCGITTTQLSLLPSCNEVVTQTWPVRALPTLSYSDWFTDNNMTQTEWLKLTGVPEIMGCEPRVSGSHLATMKGEPSYE